MSENRDEYNGWTNRETWAVNLWLSNDQGLSGMTQELVVEAVPVRWLPMVTKDEAARTAGEAVQAFVDELTDPSEELLSVDTLVSFLKDVGSLYRVNWDEVGAAWLPEDED